MFNSFFDLDKQKAKRLGLALNTEPLLIRYLYYNRQALWLGGLAIWRPHYGGINPVGGSGDMVTRSLFLNRTAKKCQILYKINNLQQNFIKNSCTSMSNYLHPQFPSNTYRYKTPRPIDTHMYKKFQKTP